MAAPGIYTFRDFYAQFENWSQDKAGVPPADAGWFPGAVYGQFLAARAQDILEDVTLHPNAPNKFVQQTLGCVMLEEARVEECPCAPPSGCTWLRTAEPLPTPIGDLIAVTGIGGNLEKLDHLTYRDWTNMKFTLQSRIPAERRRTYYTLRNNYLYAIGPSNLLKAVAVAGMFFDPVEAQRGPDCQGKTDYCTPFMDFAVYIDPAKIMKLLATTYQLIAGMAGKAPLDTTNNAQPAPGTEPYREW